MTDNSGSGSGSDEESSGIVIDNGSGMTKAGFSGDDAPKSAFPAMVAVPKYEQVGPKQEKELYIGEDAVAKRGVCKIHYPVKNGVVTNWEYMEKVWHHCYFNELRVQPEDHAAMLTEAPRNPLKNREKMCQIFFESFQVPAFHVSIQAILSLYSSGRTTGLVVDAGDGVTHTVPVFQGYSLPHCIQRNDLAGRQLTEYLCTILRETGHNFVTSAERDCVKSFKEKHCYVAMDYEKELEKFKSSSEHDVQYELPDGQVMTVGNQMFRAPEAFFKPSFLGLEIPSLHDLTHNCIKACDMDLRKEMYQQMVMSGGSTMYPGIPERLEAEMKNLAPNSMTVKISAPQERKFSVWIGGSILSSLQTFESMWITREDFEEYGPSIVQTKC